MPEFDYLLTDFHTPYICSFTPVLRIAYKLMGTKEKLKSIVEGVIEDVTGNEQIANGRRSRKPLGKNKIEKGLN